MTVEELKKVLENYPDDTLVLVDNKRSYFNIKGVYGELTPDEKVFYICIK